MESPIGALLARCYASRETISSNTSSSTSTSTSVDISAVAGAGRLEYTCVPVLVVGGELQVPLHREGGCEANEEGKQGPPVLRRSVSSSSQAGVSAVSVSADWRFILAGRVDGSSVRWQVQ